MNMSLLGKNDIFDTYTQVFDIDMPIYCCRQNPYAKTDQSVMLEFMREYKIITSPFGHDQWYAQRVDAGEYNEYSTDTISWVSKSQDRKFVDTLQIGDFVATPLAGKRKIIISQVASNSYRRNFQNVFIVWDTSNPGTPIFLGIYYDINRFRDAKYTIAVFSPIVRDIIIHGVFSIPNTISLKKHFVQSSFTQIRHPDTVKFIKDLLPTVEIQ